MTLTAPSRKTHQSITERRPLVSILIPAYNAEAWIRHSIESALTQTYSRIEVIVLDDGSTDRTAAEADAFGDRITVLRNSHQGANIARNLLTEAARGEWVQYLDADDYLLPNKIKDQIYFLNQQGWNLDVVYSPTIVRQESSCVETATSIQPPFETETQFIRWSPFCTHGMLLRRSAVVAAGGWLASQPVCQEHELLFRLITTNRRFGVWNQPSTVYRYHTSNTISHKNPLRTIQTRMGILDRFERWLLENHKMTQPIRKEIYAARLDAARVAWPVNQEYGEALARQANGAGHHWISGRHCLPARFQLLNRTLGFRRAQHIAQIVRRRRTG